MNGSNDSPKDGGRQAWRWISSLKAERREEGMRRKRSQHGL